MLNNKRGIAFFLVFVLIGFTTAIIMAIGIQIQNQAHITKVVKEKEIAFLIAQAGLKAVYYEEQRTNWSWFTHEPNDAHDDYELPDTPPDPVFILPVVPAPPLPIMPVIDGAGNYVLNNIMGGDFKVTAWQDLNDDEVVIIESTGTYGSQSVKLSTVYKRELFNEYFIFTPGQTGRTSYNWTLDAGNQGKIYVGGDFWMGSHINCQGNLNVIGSMTVLGKISEWTWEDTNSSADIEYYINEGNRSQRWVRSFYLGLDGTGYGDSVPPGFRTPPGFNYGVVKINGVPLRSPGVGSPVISGACSDMSGYIYPAWWLDEVSPKENRTYHDILAFDEGLDTLPNTADDVPIPIIPGILRANIFNDFDQRLSDRETAWQQFMVDYNAANFNNIFVPPAAAPVTLPNYDVLAESAYIHIVDPAEDPNIADDDIVSAEGDIPGCVAIIDFYDPALCYEEDVWANYTPAIRNAYIAAYPAIDTTDVDWLNHHDGSVVGLPISGVVVIDVAKMVDPAIGNIPDKSVIHSQVPVILLGTSLVDKTFTFMCDDNLYLQGDFNLGDPTALPIPEEPKSITLMSRTQGFYQSDTFIVSKDPFVINSYYTRPAKGTELQALTTAAPWFKVIIPRSPGHSDSIPVAVPTTQNALFVGLWGDTREDWCSGSVPLTQAGAFITLDSAQMNPIRTYQRTSLNEYNVAIHKIYSGTCTNFTQSYCDAFYDNPAAGQIAGRQLLEWRID